MKKIVLLRFLLALCVFSPAQETAAQYFTNPLLPAGADPWSIYHEGFYYYTHTMGDRIMLWKTRNIGLLKDAEKKTIWMPPRNTAWSEHIWAPEIHLIDNKWYVYFAADDGNNHNHRMYVLVNSSPDPMSANWTFGGKLADSTDKWAIDGSVFTYKDRLYMIWSGWEGEVNGQQNIYIGRMTDPTTMEGGRVCISTPQYSWEKHGKLNDPKNPPHVSVNEGPQFLEKNGRLFIIYSASGCWTEHYTLGMLTASAADDLLDSASWRKSPEPVFTSFGKSGVYAAGHNSFFKSPDGTEDWILYHANSAPHQGCGNKRTPRAQRFSWTADGHPIFGDPIRTDSLVPIPSEKTAVTGK